jgi:hypothetical protein
MDRKMGVLLSHSVIMAKRKVPAPPATSAQLKAAVLACDSAQFCTQVTKVQGAVVCHFQGRRVKTEAEKFLQNTGTYTSNLICHILSSQSLKLHKNSMCQSQSQPLKCAVISHI